MLCDKCKKNNATVHYRYNENGNITEYHLCGECAKIEGILGDNNSSVSGAFAESGIFNESLGKLPFSSLFGNMISPVGVGLHQKVCPGCGLTEKELRSGGKLGCEKCYSVFSDLVNSMLNRMHMSTEYKGKIPEKTENIISVAGRIEILRADMQKAVTEQRYEDAARIRDAIKDLEKDISNNGGDE